MALNILRLSARNADIRRLKMCDYEDGIDGFELGIFLAIGEEMAEQERERFRIERDLEPFDPDSLDEDNAY